MITDLEPPAERDLPPARAAHLRAALLRRTRAEPRKTRRGLRLTVAATLTVAAAFGAFLVRPQHLPTTLAMGPGELSPTLSADVDDCLRVPANWRSTSREPYLAIPVDRRDVAVASEAAGRTAILFLNRRGYATCTTVRTVNPITRVTSERSRGLGSDAWGDTRDWLPGPVQVLWLESSGDRSGWVSASGRVSHRVSRLVLDHGSGKTTRARLVDGAFGLLTTTADVRPGAQLIAYDANGAVILRERLFAGAAARIASCYVSDTGKVVYRPVEPEKYTGKCVPAERWHN
ncbi:hypothetical protein ACTOB_005896 [Actinoplanes oblitus]|uniref:Uncharacterized protein n=1 Tax=Actinoplanes oblitus TaxID=3040509 RepID=A0ABY8W972_9ACTN|nr:hypothetical protein [Actinoplanes oblitus]WIM93902.1 hypothetical protein ACTOB_005896 [Actinoplanes oblitus]